jgi:hypothetical protein
MKWLCAIDTKRIDETPGIGGNEFFRFAHGANSGFRRPQDNIA